MQGERLITPYKVLKAYRYLKHFGPKEFINHLRIVLSRKKSLMNHGTGNTLRRKRSFQERRTALREGPLISILVPAFRTPEKYFGK